MPRNTLDVRSDTGRWVIVHNGELRASLTTRARAVAMARGWARLLQAVLTITNERGDVVETREYGRDRAHEQTGSRER